MLEGKIIIIIIFSQEKKMHNPAPVLENDIHKLLYKRITKSRSEDQTL